MASKNSIAMTKQPMGANQTMDRMKLFWAGLQPKQRVYLSVGLGVTLAVAILFIKMIMTPNYKLLMSGLEAADVQTISAQLAAKKIPYLVSPDGTSVSVPADQVDAARLEVASHDSPHSGRIGFEIFDKVSWGQTEFDEKVNYQRALEGELERTIQTISNVKTARVHLVMATDSVFLDRERGAKASVTVRLRRGSLSREELSSISRLVAGAVDELKPADVVILNADSNQSLMESNGSSDGSEGIDQELTKRVIATLSPIVGLDRIHASVNVEYETGSSEESQEKYDPAVSATLSMQNSEEVAGGGSGVGGVPGTSSNVPVAKVKAATPPTVAKDLGQSSKSETATYGVNRITRHEIEPAGGIRRITVAVLLDDVLERKQVNGKWVEIHHKRPPEDLKRISELAQAAIGFNSSRGDIISVENLTFDRAEADDSLPLTFEERARKGLSDYSSVVRYGALLVLFLLLYLLMIRPIQKRILLEPEKVVAVTRALEVPEAEPAAISESVISLTQRSSEMKKELADYVQADPESSTTAVRAWLLEEAP